MRRSIYSSKGSSQEKVEKSISNYDYHYDVRDDIETTHCNDKEEKEGLLPDISRSPIVELNRRRGYILFILGFIFAIGCMRTYDFLTDGGGDSVVGKIKLSSNSLITQEKLDGDCPPAPDLSSLDAGAINRLRRSIGIENPACYARYLPLFAEYMKNRLTMNPHHLSLHIPKTGGTSLCKLARSLNKVTPKTSNCWERKHFRPIWCCHDFEDREEWSSNVTTACDVLNSTLPSFTMNENYLDHPLCDKRIYSVLLRNPIERARSQERHLGFFDLKRGQAEVNSSNDDFLARLNLTRNNYMTWALAVGSIDGPGKLTALPQHNLLEIAKRTLLQIDFLLDPSQNQKCNKATLSLMGFGNTTLPHANEHKNRFPELQHNISHDIYKVWNALDIELYHYAQRLIELDCEFFLNWMIDDTVLLPKESEPVLSNKTTETTFQYDLQDAIDSTTAFRSTVGVLLYRPFRDDFVMYYNEDEMEWKPSCRKLSSAFKRFVTLVRHEFPTKFQGSESDELAIVISGGDSPMLSRPCLASFPNLSKDCVSYKAPILHFGSVFRNGQSLSNMISMPMSTTHLPCFAQWATKRSICDPFKTTYEEKFEELIPQVVWRGTDFGYLGKIKVDLRRPSPKKDIDDKISPQDIADPKEKKVAATNELLKIFDSLIPRWKGVVLTAEAEVEAQQAQEDQQDDNALPWADIKFTRASPATNKDTKADFAKLDGYINSKGEHMSLEELARYKYHIDLGGGGGTTWTGTIAKLAMPGLLFHHVTPTKDYIHDYMKPWTHYVPIKEDLSDLKDKYVWAESHPEAAKKIATQGSELIRYLGTPQGFGEMYQEVFVDQVRQVIEAYQPVSATQSESTWENVLEGYKGLVKLVCENGEVCQLQTDDSFKAHDSFKAQKYIRDFKSAFDQPLQAILNPSHSPLIFSAGEGTTATHAFYDATCELGLRSVHWGQSCNHDVGFSNKKPSAGVMAHFDLLRAYNRLKNCATSLGDAEDVECPTVNRTLHVMLHRINQVISSPDIDAIHDAPYPNFGEYILDATKNIRGKKPIVVLGERNPQDWTKRRIQQHQKAVACRGNDIGTNLYRCLQLAIQTGLGNERINTIFYQLKEPESHANITIAKGFEMYQNKMRKVAAYHTNLFERNPRIDKSQLAKEIGYVIADTSEESTTSFQQLSSSPIRYAMDPKTSA